MDKKLAFALLFSFGLASAGGYNGNMTLNISHGSTVDLSVNGTVVNGTWFMMFNFTPAPGREYNFSYAIDGVWRIFPDTKTQFHSFGVLLSSNTTLGNVVITGNLSAKRPYFVAIDTTTQNMINSSVAQVVNISNVTDAYLITLVNGTNITFLQNGVYRTAFSPEYWVTNGSNKHFAFWLRKNGVDINWSNNREEVAAQNEERVSNYVWQERFNVNDVMQIMWWSDSTSSQLLTITGLVTPTRPNIPSVVVAIEKVSEIP